MSPAKTSPGQATAATASAMATGTDLALGSSWHDRAFGRARSQSVATDNSSVDIEMRREDEEYDHDHTKGRKKEGAFVVNTRQVNVPALVGSVLLCVAVFFVLLACVINALHRIDEGHVGVYFKYGALLPELTEPGIHWSQPFVTRVEQITVRPDTKYMDPMVCTTKDGVRNVFRDVQVISSVDKDQVLSLVRDFGVSLKTLLVYERVTEAVQLFCANHTIDEVYNTHFLDILDFVRSRLQLDLAHFVPDGGIRIWNVFLPKPDVPPAIANNYRQVKIEWTQQLIAQQKQVTDQILKQTEKLLAVADAERQKEVDLIHIAKRIQEEDGLRNISIIRNDIDIERTKTEADAHFYVMQREAEANKDLLTDQYVRLNVARSIANNTKMYFSGTDGLVGSFLANVLGKEKHN